MMFCSSFFKKYVCIKQFFIALCLLVLSNSIFSQQPATVLTRAANPARINVTSDFSFNNDSTCSGTVIQFTSNPQGGTAPYTYLWDFGDATPTSTAANPTHSFTSLGCSITSFLVKLTVTDAGGSQNAITKRVTVKQIPDVGVKDQNSPFNPFNNCGNSPTPANPNYTITVLNNSPNASCITSYSINWGDGTSQNGISFPITHTYIQLGAFNLIITGVGTNGCSNSKTYVVANQSNPGAYFGTIPNTTSGLCAPATVPLVISNWEGNSPGTTYVLNFGDGSPSVTLTHPLNSTYTSDTIYHVYTTSSCPSTAFVATLDVINACSGSPYSAGNIQVRIKPKAAFTFPASVCAGGSNCFTNTSIPGSSGSSCANQTIYTWDYGDGSATVTGTTPPCHVYSTIGNYTAKLIATNGCGTDTFTKAVCVRTPPTASFIMNKRTGCAPDTVTITNTSPFGTCGGETYSWQIAYNDVQNCGASGGVLFVGGTGPSTRDAAIRFTAPGRYVISLTEMATATGCATAIFRDTFFVKAKPKITLSTLAAVCLGNPVNPSASVVNCYSSQVPIYHWTLTGGTPSGSDSLNPGPVIYGSASTYSIIFTAENECGISTANTNVTINNLPTANAGPDTSTCSGIPVRIGVSTGNYVYSWSPTTGLSNANIANPILTFNYTGTNADTLLVYVLTVSGGANCNNRDTVPVRIKRKPVVVVSPVSATSCNGSGAILIATGATTYSWSPAVIPNNSGDTVTAIPAGISPVTYTVTGMLNGCTAPAQATITPRMVMARDSIMCNNSTAVQMTATPAGGTWSGHTAVTSSGVFNPSVAGIGVHNLIYTYLGCTDTAQATVIGGEAARAGNDSSICQAPGTIQLNGQPTGGTWGGSLLVNSSGVFSTNTPGTYTLIYRIGTGSCIARDTVVITIVGGITNNLISANQSICNGGQPVQINGQLVSGGNGTPQYLWEQSADSVNWLPITPLAIGQNFTPPTGLTQTVWYRRKASTTLCSGPQTSISLPVKVTIYPNAIAQFNPTTTVGCAPFSITPAILNLMPYSTADSAYRWYVNDTLRGINQAFGYTMNLPGDSITIKLVAISRYGCKSDSMQWGFKTIIRPTPAFTQSDSVNCGPLSIYFTNGTPNAAQYSYLWDFGTGQTSTQQQPAAINFSTNPFGGDTVYTVKFKTITQCDTITLLRYVRVKGKPKALFTPDRSTGCSSYNFTFTNTSRGNGASYVWDFGDGSPVRATNADTVQHIYRTGIIDTFSVKLKATNECGTDSLVYKLVVQPITIRPDFAINGNERYGCGPTHTVHFINNSQGGSIFKWKFGNGDSLLTYRNVDTITYTYNTAGTFTVTMQATNNCSDTTDVELVTVYPKPTVAFTATPLAACFGDTIRMNNTSDTGLVNNWRFGDGSTSLLRNPNHVYASGGTYRIWLKGVKAYPSGVSCTDSAYRDVLVRDTLTGLFTASDTVVSCTPAIITFKNSNRPAALTTWMFGDGGTATGDSVVYTYSLPGIYNVKMTSYGLAGCTYTFSKTITVTGPTGTLQYNSGYLCPGNPLQMQVTTNAATQQIRYVFGDGDSLTTTATQVSHNYLQPGIYIPYAYVIAGNCATRLTRGDTVKVDRLRAGFRTQQQQLCGATIVTFTDTSSAYFGIQSRRYNFLTDGTSSTQQNPVKTYTASGTYNVRLSIVGNSGCVDMITIPVVVVVHRNPVSTISGDSVACISQPIALTALVQSADAIVSHSWDFGNGITGTGATTTAVYNQPGNFTVQLISRTTFGCADTVYKTVRVSPSPLVNAGPDVRICRGQSIQLGAIGANTWQWSPLQNLSCTSCPNPVANPLFTTSYVATGSNGGQCRASDTILVEVVQPFNLTVSPTTSMCVGDSMQIFANGAYTYAWSPATSIVDNPAISNPTINPRTTTVYQVVGKDRYNCFTDTDYVRINVGQYPTVALGPDQTITVGQTIVLNPVTTNGPITRWTWTPATGLSCANCPNPTLGAINNTTYRLEVENQYGCKARDTIIITTLCGTGQMYVPNAFSPDGDGTNDVFFIKGGGISIIKNIRVFNRWGQVVYERSNINPDDPQQGWNGKINGVPAAIDVYVVTAEVMCVKGEIFHYKGNVSLLR